MSLDKAIQYKKENRKPYRGAAAWDSHCRNNNYCSYCRDNRTYSSRKHLHRTWEEIDRWEEDMTPGIGGLWEGWEESRDSRDEGD